MSFDDSMILRQNALFSDVFFGHRFLSHMISLFLPLSHGVGEGSVSVIFHKKVGRNLTVVSKKVSFHGVV